eukprot:TRINITY_DN10635_c0_g6_i1.p1 TRINITY_DN10635_c0_g6~~TRINITY_DN10635_c0_g6_i1.p1  ORF type:complete len:766 (-),score=142.67 TRINITY_DN10635_c0_g6_i1:342-2639(-)
MSSIMWRGGPGNQQAAPPPVESVDCPRLEWSRKSSSSPRTPHEFETDGALDGLFERLVAEYEELKQSDVELQGQRSSWLTQVDRWLDQQRHASRQFPWEQSRNFEYFSSSPGVTKGSSKLPTSSCVVSIREKIDVDDIGASNTAIAGRQLGGPRCPAPGKPSAINQWSELADPLPAVGVRARALATSGLLRCSSHASPGNNEVDEPAAHMVDKASVIGMDMTAPNRPNALKAWPHWGDPLDEESTAEEEKQIPIAKSIVLSDKEGNEPQHLACCREHDSSGDSKLSDKIVHECGEEDADRSLEAGANEKLDAETVLPDLNETAREHDLRKKSWSGIARVPPNGYRFGDEKGPVTAPVLQSSKSENFGQGQTAGYDVSMYYYETGIFQLIARSETFAHVTLAVIACNTVYIGVAADHNPHASLLDAHIGFQICEHMFCVFFANEWLCRFLAFEKKLRCLKDLWFKFDTALVVQMVFETWLAPFVITESSTAPVGMVKLLRLLRLARMARLMRAFPELVAMIKGLREASRAVGSSMMMVLLLIYIFAIIMKMLMEPYLADPLLHERFETLPKCMWTLFMDGTLLDGVSITSREMMHKEAYAAFFVLLVFVLMSAMTVMNMLIGVLCEVVTAVAAAEKEDAAIRLVKETVLVMLQKLDEDGSGEISKEEMNMVFDDKGALAVLSSLQVDITHLVDYLDMYFEQQSDLSIHQIMDLILMLRGDRLPTMKDVLDREAFARWKLHSALGIAEARIIQGSHSLMKQNNDTKA